MKKSNVISIVTPVILERVAKAKAAKWKKPRLSYGRCYVEVSYAQKDEAKMMGCKWDAVARRWYASSYDEAELVERLLRESRETQNKKSLTK